MKTCSMHGCNRKCTHTKLQARNLDGTDNFADLGVDSVIELHVNGFGGLVVCVPASGS
jgi:hypothetical protein